MTREEVIKICIREKDCVQAALDVCADGGHYVSPDGIITAADYVEAMGLAISALREQPSPCAACGYGGKHLDAPPCTTCPAHPKLESNLKVVESTEQSEAVTKCNDLYDEDGGEIFNRPESGTVKNEPLTLEELRQMDCQPVWIPLEPPASVWALVSASEGNNPVFTFPEGEQCFIEEWLEEIGPVYRRDVSSL